MARLFAEPDLKRALFHLITGDADVRAILAVASDSLTGGIERWRERGPESDDGTALPALSYVIRSCSRATPFAASATVGLVRLAENDADPVVVERAFRRHTRPDASFVFDVAAALEQRPDVFAHVRIADSGCSHLVNGRLEVADFARTELALIGEGFEVAAFLPTALNETRAVACARRLSRGGEHTATELAREMSAELGASFDDCVGLLRELVRLGVLITELRVPPIAERGALLLESLERVAPHDARLFSSMLTASADADTVDLADSLQHYDNAAAAAQRLVAADHWRQVDATRSFQGALGPGVARDLKTVLSALAPLSPVIAMNAAIANAFLETYAVRREVPLLTVLDQNDGFPFERALADALPDTSVAHAALLELAARAIRDGATSIELGAAELEGLAQRRPSGRYPHHVEALCHVGRTADGRDRVVLFTGAHAGAHLTLGRFRPDIEVDPVAEPSEPNTIDAELAILPHRRRSGNIFGRRADVEYEVLCGVRATRPADHVIALDDLVVGVHHDRAYLRSVRLGTFVRVLQHDVANTAYVSRIAQFFEALFAPDVRQIAFDWGTVARSLPFTPRVTIAGVAVAPATWRVPKRIAMQMESVAARDWRTCWQLPQHVYVVEADNRLLLDLDHALCRSIVARTSARLEDHEFLTVHEALPFFGDGLPGVAGTEYFAEAAISFHCTYPEQRPTPVFDTPTVRPNRSDRLRPLGSDWIYAKFYVGAPRASYFLERSIAAMLADMEPEIDLFHFLRYADPAHHVRVRFRAKSAERAHDARERALRFVETLTSAGIVDGAVWDVYDREIERYGGLRAIETAERIFDADSRALLAAFPAFRTSDDTMRDLLRDIADFTNALCGGAQQALLTIRATIGRRDRLTSKQWATVRAAREVRSESRYGAISAFGAILRRDAGTEATDISRTLVHMHCNRLGLHALEEQRALHLISGIFEGDVATRGAGSTGDDRG